MKVLNRFEEVNLSELDVFFSTTAAQAEDLCAGLKKNGREVVSVFEETLLSAVTSLHVVCVAKSKKQVGPLGFDRKK